MPERIDEHAQDRSDDVFSDSELDADVRILRRRFMPSLKLQNSPMQVPMIKMLQRRFGNYDKTKM